VLKDLGTDPNNPNPGRWDTPISLPYPQPSHEPRPPCRRTSGLDNTEQRGLGAPQPQPPKEPDLRHPTPVKREVP